VRALDSLTAGRPPRFLLVPAGLVGSQEEALDGLCPPLLTFASLSSPTQVEVEAEVEVEEPAVEESAPSADIKVRTRASPSVSLRARLIVAPLTRRVQDTRLLTARHPLHCRSRRRLSILASLSKTRRSTATLATTSSTSECALFPRRGLRAPSPKTRPRLTHLRLADQISSFKISQVQGAEGRGRRGVREVREVLPLPVPYRVGDEVERGARGRYLAWSLLRGAEGVIRCITPTRWMAQCAGE